MNALEQSRLVLERLVPQLQADGYTVYIEPSRQLLPPFMEGYTPDAIAIRPGKNLAIEVVVEGSSSDRKLERIRPRFDGVKDWELRVYYARPVRESELLPPISKGSIEESIRSIEALVASGQPAAALLMAWATLEGLGRLLLPERFARPQSPGRLVEVLAGEGYITPSEADLIRSLVRRRNHLIHGSLETNVEPSEVSAFVEVMKTLLKSEELAEG